MRPLSEGDAPVRLEKVEVLRGGEEPAGRSEEGSSEMEGNGSVDSFLGEAMMMVMLRERSWLRRGWLTIRWDLALAYLSGKVMMEDKPPLAPSIAGGWILKAIAKMSCA